MPLLSVQNVSSGYGKSKILDNVSFYVNKGEVVSLIGPNGAGKSTALKTVFRFLGVQNGEIDFDGEKIINKKPHELASLGLSFVHQGRQIFRNMNVENNLLLGAFIDKKYEKNLENVYSIFPILKQKRKQIASTLSGGQQQQLAIGRALMLEPKLLLLDEPSLGLDPKTVRLVFEKIKEINKKGTTILLVEQNAHMALEISDRAYVFETGKIKLTGKGERPPEKQGCSEALFRWLKLFIYFLSISYDYVFRDYPSDAFQGKIAAEYAFNTKGARKASVLYINNDWGIGIKDTFISRFKELGGKVEVIETFEQGANDLRTQLTKIKTVNSDIIYFPSYPAETTIGLKQAKELGLKANLFLGGDGSEDATIAQNVGEAGEGFIWLIPSVNPPEEFVKKFKEKTGKEPSLAVPQAYDIVNILADSMKRVSTDPTKIKNDLYNVKNYKGVSGTITLDQNGDLVDAKYQFRVIRNSKMENA